MGEVANISMYPLAGAQPVELGSCRVTPGGIEGDRMYVAYDAAQPEAIANDGEIVYPRISQSQYREFAQIQASVNIFDDLLLSRKAGLMHATLRADKNDIARESIRINEFGDLTHCYDMGEVAAMFLKLVIGDEGNRNKVDPRLGKKSDEWQAGGITPPQDRSVAPLHIINEASVDALRNMPEAEGMNFEANRLRANFVFRGFKPFAEYGWLGKIVEINGNVPIRITRVTERCNVPGNDQFTGKNMRDIPKLYKYLPKGKSSGIFGVYGVPLVGSDTAEVSIGDSVSVR